MAGRMRTLIVGAAVVALGGAASAGAVVSDDFNRCLNPQDPWRLADPLGGGVADIAGAGTGDAHLRLHVPAGISRDPWGIDRSLQLSQPAPDEDFTITARFVSAVSQRYQTQGLVVVQNTGNWLRFDMHHDGGTVRAFAASTSNGTSRAQINRTFSPGQATWLQVQRAGDLWTYRRSANGTTWTTLGTFTRDLGVSRVGVFAANAPAAGENTAPAHTAEIDYFVHSADPLSAEDQGPAPADCNGDPTPSAPQVSQIQVAPATDGATITWRTDVPTTGILNHGPTTALGQHLSSPQGTAHTATIAGLLPATTHHYAITAAPLNQAPITTTPVAAFTTLPATPDPEPEPDPEPSGGVVSDDFNSANLNTDRWALVDPVGGGRVAMAGTGTANARVVLSVPAGASRDPWGPNRATRIMQTVADGDLDIRARFLSTVAARYQLQGFIVQQDADNWLRFEMHHDGSRVRLYAGSTVRGTTSSRINVPVNGAAPGHLRVTRTGATWRLMSSTDGITWTTAGQFSAAYTVGAVGLMAANANASGEGTAPAHAAEVDYFATAAAPPDPEDGAVAPDTRPPLVHDVAAEPGADTIRVGWATDEPATTVVRYGRTAAYELGQVAVAGTRTDHRVDLTGLAGDTLHHLQVVSTDAGGRTTTANLTARTGAAQTSPRIEVFHGPNQSVGWPGIAQDVVNVMGNVADAGDVASLTYALNGGPQRTLRLGPDGRRLQEAGDFNAEIAIGDLAPGANSVVLRATYRSGAVASRTVGIQRTVGAGWPLPHTTNWAAATDLTRAAQLIDGQWSTSAAGVRTERIGYDRLLAVGDRSWTDYEVRVPVTIHSIDTVRGNPHPSNGPVVGLGLRWQGHTQVGSEQPRAGYMPVGAYAWHRWRPNGTRQLQMDMQGRPRVTNATALQTGVTYIMAMRVVTQANGHGRYSYKVWPQGAAEPSGWQLQNEGVQDLASGSVLLIAHHADVTFGNLTITPLGG